MSNRANVDRGLAGNDLWGERRDRGHVKRLERLGVQVRLLEDRFVLLLDYAFFCLVREFEFASLRLSSSGAANAGFIFGVGVYHLRKILECFT